MSLPCIPSIRMNVQDGGGVARITRPAVRITKVMAIPLLLKTA